MRTDIYVIRYNNYDVEEKCLDRIRKYTDFPYTLHEYDNYVKKEGVSTLWNRWLKGAKNPVCFINSDAYVSKGWLGEMMKWWDDDVAAIGPSGNIWGTEQGKIRTKKDANKHVGKFLEAEFLSGFCLLVKDVGVYFPEDIPFYHNEIAWQHLLKIDGYKSIWAQGSFVKHIGGSTARKEKTKRGLEANGSKQYEEFMKGLDNVRQEKSNA